MTQIRRETTAPLTRGAVQRMLACLIHSREVFHDRRD